MDVKQHCDWRVLLCGTLAAVGLSGGATVDIKYPDAPFVPKAVETYRPDAVVDGRRIISGDKVLHFLNDLGRKVGCGMRLTIADKTAFEILCHACPSEPGWDPFGNFPEETLGNGRIVRARPFKVAKAAPGGVFRQTGEVKDGKAVVMTHFILEDGAPLKRQNVCYYLPLGYVCGGKVVVTDAQGERKTFEIPTAEGWKAACPTDDWKGLGGVDRPAKIAVRPDEPTRGFALEFIPDEIADVSFFLTNEGLAFHLNTSHRLGRSFTTVVDFGVSAKPDKADCIVNGINFTRNNDSEYAHYPEPRNFLVNPSFESGARYFHDVRSGADIRKLLVEGDARSGRFSLRLGNLRTFAMPTKPGRKYVLSLYAKAADDKTHDLNMTAWSYEVYDRGRVECPVQRVSGGEWKRYAFTFEWPYDAVTFSLAGDGALVDDLQFEEGVEPTAYVGNKLGVDMVTDVPDVLYADVGVPFNARFAVRGPAGTKGTLKTEVVDFFGRSLWKEDVGFDLNATGVAETVALPEPALAARGAFVVRLTVKPEGMPAYRDFFRLARFPFADGKAKNRLMHMVPNPTWPNPESERTVEVRNFRRALVTGTACRLRLIDHWGRKFTKEDTQEVLRRYNVARAATYDEVIRDSDCAEMEKRGLGNPHKLLSFSPESLRFIEQRAYENAVAHPEIEVWDVGNETSGNWEAARQEKYDEFVKFALAIQRGVHRACPDKPVTVYGTCNNSEIGRREIRAFLAAWKRAAPSVRPSAVNVHPYLPNPDAPDMDRDFKALMDDLDRLGYPDVPVYADEGAFFLPLVLNDWNGACPGMSTQSGDGLALLHMPSYDLGWGERLAAAYWIRYVFMGYKYMPRLKCLSGWGTTCFTMDDPFAQYVANAAMVDLVGNGTFLRDIRFAPGARAYVFNDGKGGAVAVYWRHTAGMDNGTEPWNSLTLDLRGLDARILDLMGNVVTLPKSAMCGTGILPVQRGAEDGAASNGRDARSTGMTTLPLGVFPMYVKTSVDKIDGLVKAFERAKTDVVVSEKDSVKVPSVTVPHVTGTIDWTKVPAMEIPYVEQSKPRKVPSHPQEWTGPDDVSAVYRFAWNEENLYLRIEVKDDKFVTDTSSKWGPSGWYESDSVQLYFDTFGDAKRKFADGYADHDENDMSYELLPTNATTAVVFRRTAPDYQLTGGVHGGLLGNRLEPAVCCDFKWDETAKTRTYTARFPRRYVQPIMLAAGTRFGFGLYVIDRDYPEDLIKTYLSNVDPSKGSSATHPYLYTDIILGD